MTDVSRDPGTNAALNGPVVPLEQKAAELLGQPTDERQTAYFDREDVDDLGDFTRTDHYQGEAEAGVDADLPNDEEDLELLTELELRAGETDDAMVAIEEGLTYVPPIDPPTVPSEDRQDAEMASGFGVSSLDEEYDTDHHRSFMPGDDEMTARVREALRADSATTQYAERVFIETRRGVVRLRGVVEDIEDSDNVAAVASNVEGVTEVIDELKVVNP